MSVVDWTFYSAVYIGEEDSLSFSPALVARAEDIVGSMCRWKVTEENIGTYPEHIQTLYKKAVCAEFDYLCTNGLTDIVSSDGRGFTVGKVTVHDSTRRSGAAKAGALICPMAVKYLEQTGLINPQVQTAPDIPYWGCWPC